MTNVAARDESHSGSDSHQRFQFSNDSSVFEEVSYKKLEILIAFTFFGSLLTNNEVISDDNRTDITNNLNLAKGTVCLPRF